MAERKIYNQHGLNFVTFTIVGWIDLFSRKQYRDIIIESLIYCQQNKGLIICGYVIMSNHIHLIVSAQNENFKLSDIIRDLKKYTSKKIIEVISEIPESRRNWMLKIFREHGEINIDNKEYQLWQQGHGAVYLTSLPVMWQKLNYIHYNPVRADIVKEPEHYIYSSAGDYINNTKGLIELEFLPMLTTVEWTKL